MEGKKTASVNKNGNRGLDVRWFFSHGRENQTFYFSLAGNLIKRRQNEIDDLLTCLNIRVETNQSYWEPVGLQEEE